MDQCTWFFKVCLRPFSSGIQLNFTALNKLVFVYLTLRWFWDGVEEYIIQPTAWYYIDYLGQTHEFLGLTLAAYSTATLVFAPFIGILEVKFQFSKGLVFMGALFKFFGNLLYSIPVNGYFPLFGRFVSGVGEATVGVLFAAITKCTTNNNRAKAFLYFECLFSVGAVTGPTIGSVLTFNVNILGWVINAGNSPGVILTITCFFLLILAIFLPRDLAETESNLEEACSDHDSDDEKILPKSITESSTCCPPSNVFRIYYTIFMVVFLHQMISFYTPLLAIHQIGLDLQLVKLIYINTSLSIFVLFIVTYLFSDKIREKIFSLVSFVTLIIPISITLFFALKWNTNLPVYTGYLLQISIIISRAGLVNFTLSCSLLSKITPTNSAAVYQSLTFTTFHVAVIFARVIGGATFAKMPMIYCCLGLTIALVFGFVWLVIEYRNSPS